MVVAYLALAGFQIIAGAQQAETIRENAKLTQSINDMNADYAELDAYEAEKFGYTQEARYETVINQTLSDIRTSYAAQDVDANFGTAAEVQAESKLNGYLNKLDIKNQAHEQAMGYKRQARNIRLGNYTSGVESSALASATQTNALIGGATTALSGYTRKKT